MHESDSNWGRAMGSELKNVEVLTSEAQIVDPSLQPPGWAISVDRLLVVATALLGVVHTWAGRYSMSPDGVSYIDVGRSFFAHEWSNAFNAYWSPLYAWILGTVLGLVHPSPNLEYPIAHLVNFGLFLATFVAFRFFLRSLMEYRGSLPTAGRTKTPDWVVILIALPLFWWACFEIIPLYEVGPDLAVSASVYLVTGFLLRARDRSCLSDFLMMGFFLGVGYWVKAPFFLLSFVFLLVAYCWGYSSPAWRSGMRWAVIVFLLTSAPLVLALSLHKHRLTFGDSARLNYAWFVAPQTFHRNWQGREPGSGVPAHATQQVFKDPPAYAFVGPVVGTYPPWLDPSYWNEGLRPRFALGPQIRALLTNLMTEASLVLRAQPALLTTVVLLFLLGGSASVAALKHLWPLPVFALAAFAMYAPVHVEPRFLGGFVVLLFLSVLAASSFRATELRAVCYLAVVLLVVMSIEAADTAYRFTTLRLAVPGNGPVPATDHVVVADYLRALGLGSGDPVAVIGDGTGAYWASLAHLRIVGEVMGADHNALRFWESPPQTRMAVLKAFQATGAKVVLAEGPPASPQGWRQIADTRWYILPLTVVSDLPH